MTSAEVARIKKHLESLGHYDREWLERYVRFIVASAYPGWSREEHHILPQSVPEFAPFADFEKHPWNCRPLSVRGHLSAHYLLLGAFRKDWHVWKGFEAIAVRVGTSSSLVDREFAEKLKTQASDLGLLDHWRRRQARQDEAAKAWL